MSDAQKDAELAASLAGCDIAVTRRIADPGMDALKRIARGDPSSHLPLSARLARQLARSALEDMGETW